MLLEGDYTNSDDINYIDSLCYIGKEDNSLTLKSEGKNIYSGNNINIWKQKNTGRVIDVPLINFKKDANYRLSYNCNEKVELKIILTYEDNNSYYFSNVNFINDMSSRGTLSSCKLYIEDKDYQTNKNFVFTNIQIEENEKTEYEEYKSDTKKIDVPYPLLRVGDSYDELINKDYRSKLIKRTSFLILNGTQNAKQIQNDDTIFAARFEGVEGKPNSKFICNHSMGYETRQDASN